LSSHWSRSDVQCDLWPFLRTPKKRQWQTGYLPRPPTSPYRSQSLHAGWSPVCSSIFQVLLKSVQWFCRCGWSKIALPHYFGHLLIQLLVLPYKPWSHTADCSAKIITNQVHRSELVKRPQTYTLPNRPRNRESDRPRGRSLYSPQNFSKHLPGHLGNFPDT